MARPKRASCGKTPAAILCFGISEKYIINLKKTGVYNSCQNHLLTFKKLSATL